MTSLSIQDAFLEALIEHGRACIDKAELVFKRTGIDTFEVQIVGPKHEGSKTFMNTVPLELGVGSTATIAPIGELFKFSLGR
jgi:hypothetical protein